MMVFQCLDELLMLREGFDLRNIFSCKMLLGFIDDLFNFHINWTA